MQWEPYTAAILNTQFHIPVIWLFPLSGLVAGLFALLVARPIIHLRGDYLCIVTIGVGEIIRIALINNVFGITGGSNGIFGISRPSFFGYTIRTPQQFFYLIWAFTGLTVFLFHLLEHSRFGRALNYLREDEIAAEGSGINIAHYKLGAFIIGAAWAGMAGKPLRSQDDHHLSGVFQLLGVRHHVYHRDPGRLGKHPRGSAGSVSHRRSS